MALYSVGQRVRKVSLQLPGDTIPIDAGVWVPVGSQGTIIGPGRFDDSWVVLYDDHRTHPTGSYTERSYKLAPLTPPAQDEWADAKVKQVTRPTYMEPVRTKERA